MREDYNSKVVFSYKEISARQKLSYKDFEAAEKLNALVTADTKFPMTITNVLEIEVHNEHSKQNKDYSVYLFVTPDTVYRSGSETLFNSVCDGLSDLDEIGENTEKVDFVVYRVKSNNYDGDFLKAKLV